MVGMIPLLPRGTWIASCCRTVPPSSELRRFLRSGQSGICSGRDGATAARRAGPDGGAALVDPARTKLERLSAAVRRGRVPLAHGLRSLSAATPRHPSISTSAATVHRSTTSRPSRRRPVRRQLQLARPDLVPGQLPRDRVARAVPRPTAAICLEYPTGRASPGRWTRSPTTCRTGSSRSSPGRRRPAALLRRDRAFQTDPHWKDSLLFYEYFHGDNGAALARRTRPAGPAWSPT